MHIARLCLRNFRNFRNAELCFEKGVNTLIGENGSGKTNAFHAIRLLLDESLSRASLWLRESDFNRASGSWKGSWIIISLEFEDLDASEGCQVLRHSVGHMNQQNKGTYTYYFRPKKAVRKALYDASGKQADIAQILDDLTIEDYEWYTTGRATANFLNDAVYRQLAGDPANLLFPNPEDEDRSVVGDPMMQPIHCEVSCTFVKALRDVLSDLRNYRDSPLLNLLRGTEQAIEVADAERILNRITELNSDISSLEEIQGIAKGIQDSLHDTVGHTYSPSIQIQSAIPEELERLLQRLCLTVSDPGDEDYKGELDELSLGGANLIYLSLKLLEYELKSKTDRVAHFLLIEEPESHIHTHVQKTLFEKYSYDNTQVIVSTHSTHISAASRIRSVNILAKDRKHAHVFHPSNGLAPEQCQRIERYLDAVRSTLLFAKGIVLVEGDAELLLIPTLIKKVMGVSLDELGVSLISMSSTVFCNVAILFDKDRVRRHCAVLTDFDESIYPLPADPKADNDEQKKARDSQTSGAQRKIQLDGACTGNDWVKPFYAPHTFEVDFLMAQNAGPVVATLPQIYEQAKSIADSKALLEKYDLADSGREVLRLAKKVGKGWLAVLMAENISVQVTIPDYVLQAVAFASKANIDRKTVCQMVKYRCEKFHADGTPRQTMVPVVARGVPDEVFAEYPKLFPQDVLTTFMGLIA